MRKLPAVRRSLPSTFPKRNQRTFPKRNQRCMHARCLATHLECDWVGGGVDKNPQEAPPNAIGKLVIWSLARGRMGGGNDLVSVGDRPSVFNLPACHSDVLHWTRPQRRPRMRLRWVEGGVGWVEADNQPVSLVWHVPRSLWQSAPL